MLNMKSKKMYQVTIQVMLKVKRALVDAKAKAKIKKWYQAINQFKVSSQQSLSWIFSSKKK